MEASNSEKEEAYYISSKLIRHNDETSWLTLLFFSEKSQSSKHNVS